MTDSIGVSRAGKMLDAYNAAQRKVDEQNDIKNVLEYTSNVADLKHAIVCVSLHAASMQT